MGTESLGVLSSWKQGSLLQGLEGPSKGRQASKQLGCMFSERPGTARGNVKCHTVTLRAGEFQEAQPESLGVSNDQMVRAVAWTPEAWLMFAASGSS